MMRKNLRERKNENEVTTQDFNRNFFLYFADLQFSIWRKRGKEEKRKKVRKTVRKKVGRKESKKERKEVSQKTHVMYMIKT